MEYLDRRIASILSKESTYVLMLTLRKSNMVMLLWHIGDYFTPTKVESCANPMDARLVAFYLRQLLQEMPLICTFILSLWLTMLKLTLQYGIFCQ